MKPHTIYIIEMIPKMILGIIILWGVIHYFIKEYKINCYKEDLKKKRVDTKTRLKKMNKEYTKNVQKRKDRKSKKIS